MPNDLTRSRSLVKWTWGNLLMTVIKNGYGQIPIYIICFDLLSSKV